MKTPLALLNFAHEPAKSLVSIGGVAFALLLVFMQLGFMGAVSHTAKNVFEHMHFQLVITARDYIHLYEPSQFERKWLQVAASTPGVRQVKPLWITIHNWRKLPRQEELNNENFKSQYLPIAVMAFNTADSVFTLDEIKQQQKQLSSGRLLVDKRTHGNYGPLNGKTFDLKDRDRDAEVGGHKFLISGLFDLGTGLAANGAVVMSQQGFSRIVPWDIEQRVSIGLVDLEPGADHEQVLQAIRRRVEVGTKDNPSAAVVVLSRDEMLNKESERWLNQTPIGLIFQLGVVLSLLVGSAIVYMVLSTDVSNRLGEYATLLAIGYSRKYLASLVMTQAIVLGLSGFVVAWVAAEMLYYVTTSLSGITVAMVLLRIPLVLGLGLAMCCGSGLLALRKLWNAEPASLF